MPSLLEALERKYFAECEFENANEPELHRRADTNDYTVTKCSGRMEFSIFIPRLSPLTCVPELLVLNDCDIDCAGDFEAIKEKCQRVRELDLAQNKLRDWQEVFHIIKHMPRIEFLNLSKNQLMGPINQAFYTAAPITNLKNIVLNGTYLDWYCVDALLQNLPLLEELHLSLNNYTEVLIDADDFVAAAVAVAAAAAGDETAANENTEEEIGEETTNGTSSTTNTGNATNSSNANCYHTASQSDPTCCTHCRAQRKYTKAHESLKTLHFTGNPIESWQEICRLGRIFPNLENLVLADCPIKSLHADADEATEKDETAGEQTQSHKYFPNLKLLNLSYASLSAWHDIDQLAKFPKLKNLRVKHWPLWDSLECTEHERRQLLIARLPNVAMLNGGGLISADEREDAERAFIRHYMDKPSDERPQRYDELVKTHGKLDPLVNVSLKPDKRVKVIFTHNELSETRSVDIYLTVSDLKGKLEKLVGLPANKMRLFYLDKDYKEFGPEEMRFPNKQLYSYNIQAGDEIIIEKK